MSSDDYVWYSPKHDRIVVAKKGYGFVFKNEFGEFHLHVMSDFKVVEYYLIGEL